MEKVKYAVVPRFTIIRKGKMLDFGLIENQFSNWIKQFTDQGYVISRNTTISAILEPGCFYRLILRRKTEFIVLLLLNFSKAIRQLITTIELLQLFRLRSKNFQKRNRKNWTGLIGDLPFLKDTAKNLSSL